MVVDAGNAVGKKTDPILIVGWYQKFLVALRKAFAATKSGEAGFKVSPDGAFFNANGSITESFKMLEEAIVLSGANDDGR